MPSAQNRIYFVELPDSKSTEVIVAFTHIWACIL
ncbi:hypothetical protein T01_1669 [Trichinella spiralis]|uniref:Uncharacterized protein n=1 Tax=Trichinella spiralis TaxID=6334 RepID=A0A0V0Z274_TRISP|nr:hypothetical protein T01_1669 [Trichinella spiralis]